MEEGGKWEGKRSGGTGKRKKEEVNGESTLKESMTKFLTMFAYEWYCMKMCICIILIVNLPPE